MKKLLNCLGAVGVVIILTRGVNINAAEKKIDVPINKDYTSMKFDLDFDFLGEDYDVYVLSPNGDRHDVSTRESNKMECIIDDAKQGTWKVVVSSEITENAQDLSPVKITFEGSSEVLLDVDKNIKVSTDIVGLSMYLDDDSFVAEWKDSTCGNVNIKIVNASNLQVLCDEKIAGNRFEFEISEEVQEIKVTIVPSVSSNVAGAEKTYDIIIDNNPDAKIVYEDVFITNKENIIVQCELNEEYGLEFFVNDKLVLKEQNLKKGSYEKEIPIDVGINEVKTYVVDKNGNKRSTQHTVEVDVVAPILKLASTYNNIQTYDESIVIEGEIQDFDSLTINDKEIEVEGDNTFKIDYKLKDGYNNIILIASDLAGNETVYNISAEKLIKEEKESGNSLLIMFLVAIAVIVLVLSFLKKPRGKHKKTINVKNDNGRNNVKKERVIEEYNPVFEDEMDEVISYDSLNSERTQKKRNSKIEKLSTEEKNQVIRNTPICDAISFLIPLIVIYIVFSFIIFVSTVSSGSMEPSLKVGQTVFYNRLAYIAAPPERGDVVVFYSDEFHEYFGKRVIGIPGDEISFIDGYVVINGMFCDESAYLNDSIETNCVKTFTVPEGHYFMLGDNREDSNDSRYWSEPYISIKSIKGKYMGKVDLNLNFFH